MWGGLRKTVIHFFTQWDFIEPHLLKTGDIPTNLLLHYLLGHIFIPVWQMRKLRLSQIQQLPDFPVPFFFPRIYSLTPTLLPSPSLFSLLEQQRSFETLAWSCFPLLEIFPGSPSYSQRIPKAYGTLCSLCLSPFPLRASPASAFPGYLQSTGPVGPLACLFAGYSLIFILPISSSPAGLRSNAALANEVYPNLQLKVATSTPQPRYFVMNFFP